MGMNKKRKLRELWLKRILGAGLAFGLGAFIHQLPLDFLEAYAYDWRVVLQPTAQKSGLITTVAIDTPTLKALQKEPSAAELQKAFAKILEAHPARLIIFSDPTKAAGTKKAIAGLARTLNDPRVVLAIDDLPPAGELDFLKPQAPFDSVMVLPGPVTVDKSILARDGVTRRLILSSQGQQTYLPILAREFRGLTEDRIRGQFELLDANQAFIQYRPVGSYVPLSFLDLLQSRADANSLKDKIVLFGKDAREHIKDYVMTPYSRGVLAMSSLEMQANALDTVLMNRAPIPMPKWVGFLSTILFSWLTVVVVLSLRPLRGIGILTSAFSGYLITSYIFFLAFGWWIPVAHPLLAMFVCYYFFIPYRLIKENRRSWEYYQKNKLLTQVEELKSNFLRMMSHDLKTPLARVQGMANVVLSDANPLSDAQRRAVETIYRSSEELGDFIGSILNLGRIESKDIKLQFKSRDINSLVNDVIRKAEFLSRKKGIEIRTEFEPMFSFKMDDDLIRQVFTNLIENAIKYSPENGKVLITTEELEGQAIIQVADQGIGIAADDLPHVFEKFYRSREVRQSDVGGSGLGLYLVKYFVELHHGHVEVESENGKGSTFTVTLPMVVDKPVRRPPRPEGELNV
jgi:signal transduction histidine kinase